MLSLATLENRTQHCLKSVTHDFRAGLKTKHTPAPAPCTGATPVPTPDRFEGEARLDCALPPAAWTCLPECSKHKDGPGRSEAPRQKYPLRAPGKESPLSCPRPSPPAERDASRAPLVQSARPCGGRKR